jgi:hypothetical protein
MRTIDRAIQVWINRQDLYRLIQQTNGRVFTICFVKVDKTVRIMNCRLHVKKHLKGGKLLYNPIERGKVGVFDMQKKAYRMVNLLTAKWITVNGTTYSVM